MPCRRIRAMWAATKSDERRRQQEDVGGVPAAQRQRPERVSAAQHVGQPFSDQGALCATLIVTVVAQ